MDMEIVPPSLDIKKLLTKLKNIGREIVETAGIRFIQVPTKKPENYAKFLDKYKSEE